MCRGVDKLPRVSFSTTTTTGPHFPPSFIFNTHVFRLKSIPVIEVPMEWKRPESSFNTITLMQAVRPCKMDVKHMDEGYVSKNRSRNLLSRPWYPCIYLPQNLCTSRSIIYRRTISHRAWLFIYTNLATPHSRTVGNTFIAAVARYSSLFGTKDEYSSNAVQTFAIRVCNHFGVAKHASKRCCVPRTTAGSEKIVAHAAHVVANAHHYVGHLWCFRQLVWRRDDVMTAAWTKNYWNYTPKLDTR